MNGIQSDNITWKSEFQNLLFAFVIEYVEPAQKVITY
jgi:hypothetical protein